MQLVQIDPADDPVRIANFTRLPNGTKMIHLRADQRRGYVPSPLDEEDEVEFAPRHFYWQLTRGAGKYV